MADFSYVKLLDGSVAFVKDAVARNNMCEYIVGTQSGPSGAWKGNSEDTGLRDGKQILYYLPYASMGRPTLNLTFAGGTKSGEKEILKDGTTPAEETFRARSIIRLTYIEGIDAWSLDTTASDGVTNYDDLTNRPKIEDVTLEGNKTFEQLGLQSLTNSDIDEILRN